MEKKKAATEEKKDGWTKKEYVIHNVRISEMTGIGACKGLDFIKAEHTDPLAPKILISDAYTCIDPGSISARRLPEVIKELQDIEFCLREMGKI